MCFVVFLSYCYFMLSVPVQLTAWKDRPRNDPIHRTPNRRGSLYCQLPSRILDPLRSKAGGRRRRTNLGL